MSFRVLFFLTNVYLTSSNWELVFNDEFNSSIIDQNKWIIDYLDSDYCDVGHSGRLNCYTNRSENLRLIDGTLAITAIREKYFNKEYTSGSIMTREDFTYGKFEIRAALPKAKMLSPFITFYPVTVSPNYFDEIIIAANRQEQDILNEVLFKNSSNSKQDTYSYWLDKELNLNDFNTYSVEWTETELIWRLNGEQTFSYNLSQIAHPFDKPFQLVIFLRVGGKLFRSIGSILSVDDVTHWNCSLLIIDYVRIYRWNSTALNHTQSLVKSNISSTNICKAIMPMVTPRSNLAPKSQSYTLIILVSGLCFLFLVIFLPLIIYLLIRMRKLGQNISRDVVQQDCYDDIQDYFEIPKTDEEYAVPNYVIPDVSIKDVVNKIEEPRYYVQMTNRKMN